MMMDVNTLNRLVELAQKAVQPKVVELPGEPRHRYAVCTPDGDMRAIDAEPEPRKHRAYDLTAVAQLAAEFTKDAQPEAAPEGEEPPQQVKVVDVWYSRHGVVALLDNMTRRDEVRLKLEVSPQLSLLVELAKKPAEHTQRAFINLLRTGLHGALSETLLHDVRIVKFRLNTLAEGEVQHGKRSIGKQQEAELHGYDKIPEIVSAYVPVFDGFETGVVYPVKCAIEINPENSTFTLMPLPGEIEKAVRRAEEHLGDMLRHQLGVACSPLDVNPALIPVLYGVP